MISSDRDIHILGGVARLLANQVALYGRAAEIADDVEIRRALKAAEAEREKLLEEVDSKIVAMGLPAPHDGTAWGAAQRAMLNARIYLDDDNRAALGESERGEDFLRDQIQKRLEHGDLSPHTHNFLQTVLSRIAPVHDAIAGLKHAFENKSETEACRTA